MTLTEPFDEAEPALTDRKTVKARARRSDIERLVTLGHLTPRLGGHQVTDVGNVRLMMGPDA